jgi:hypothetical protein
MNPSANVAVCFLNTRQKGVRDEGRRIYQGFRRNAKGCKHRPAMSASPSVPRSWKRNSVRTGASSRVLRTRAASDERPSLMARHVSSASDQRHFPGESMLDGLGHGTGAEMTFDELARHFRAILPRKHSVIPRSFEYHARAVESLARVHSTPAGVHKYATDAISASPNASTSSRNFEPTFGRGWSRSSSIPSA